MFTVILILWGSAAIGYVLRRHPFRAVGRLTTWSVWLLLFLMGCEVGANPDLISQLGTLGLEAHPYRGFLRGLHGTVMGFLGVPPKHPKNKNTGLSNSLSEASSSPISPKPSIRQQTGESMVIVGFFAFGVSGTRLGWIPVLPPEAGFYALCLLLGCVGFSIGQNDEMRHGLRKIDKRQALLPVVTAIGTWLGAISTALLIQRHTPADWLAAGSGFGYYSLSSILITEMRGAELGTIALCTISSGNWPHSSAPPAISHVRAIGSHQPRRCHHGRHDAPHHRRMLRQPVCPAFHFPRFCPRFHRPVFSSLFLFAVLILQTQRRDILGWYAPPL